MTVQVVIDDIIPRTQLIATASQTVFNTNWTADVASDINVYARATGVDPNDATQLVSSSLYNVTFIGVTRTVRVTFLSGRTVSDVITIVRNTPAERTNLYINTNFTPSMLNQDFGILTLVDQQAQMYDTVVNPGYNISATIANKDKVLPILAANQIWAMNNANDEIIAYDVPAEGGLAPKTAKYIIQTSTAELPNAQSIADLASGLMVGTTTTGVLLSRILTGTSNQITITNGSGISGNPTVAISSNPILTGTAGLGIPQGTTAQRVIPVSGISLRYNTDLQDVEFWDGTQWVQFADPVGEALTSTDDTNVTMTLGGNPLIALVNAASLTLGWTGELSPTRGGTGINNGASTLTLAGTLATIGAFASTFTMTGATNVTFPTSGTLATTAGTVSSVSGTADRITSTGGTTPAIDIAVTYAGQASITTLGTIATGTWQGTIVSPIYGGTGVNNGASTLTLGGNMATVGAFASTFTMTGITGVTFPTSGTLATTAQIPTGAALTKTDDTNVTLTLGGSASTALVNAASITLGWTGLLSIARGGTGVGSVTTAPTASAFAGWDVNSNLSANSHLNGFATTVTAAGTTTLTVASKQIQEFTGATTQIVALPVTSTLAAGHPYQIINNSSGNVTINSSGGNAVLVMAANTVAWITCVLNSGTTAASWNASYLFDAGAGVLSITGTANQVIASASTGNVTLSLPQSIATSSAVTFGSVAFSTTSGIIGTTTNDSAAAGSVGSLISNVASPGTSLTSTVSVNGTSISLPAGDYDVWGSCYFSGLTMTLLTAGISTTSATLPDIGLCGSVGGTSLQSSNIVALPQRVSLASTTTVYIVANGTFTGSCSLNRANIYARVRR